MENLESLKEETGRELRDRVMFKGAAELVPHVASLWYEMKAEFMRKLYEEKEPC